MYVVGPTSDDVPTTAQCPGDFAVPQAAPGIVCIYVTQSDNALNVAGLSIMPGNGGSRYGFKVLWDAGGNGDTFLDATWAYRYP